MKKILLITGMISLCFACNVIYARQKCTPQEACYVENCIQTVPCARENSEGDNCYFEECPQNEVCIQNNCVRRNACRRAEQDYGQHHRYGRHH